MNLIEVFKETTVVSDKYERSNSERYYDRKLPDIKSWKIFRFEENRWKCPSCGYENTIRPTMGQFGHIITPRIYSCRCHVKRFYWRDEKNNLLARYISKYEIIDELEFISRFDPIKFYANLKAETIHNQTTLF